MLSHLTADYPALRKLLGRKIQPTPLACFFCKIFGVRAWLGKTLYGGFWRWLPLNDRAARKEGQGLNYLPLSAALQVDSNAGSSAPTHVANTASRTRNQQSRQQAARPQQPRLNTTAPAKRTAAELSHAPQSRSSVNMPAEAEELKYCAFLKLPYFDPMLMASIDPMHTIAGLMESLFACMAGGDSENVIRYETTCNR